MIAHTHVPIGADAEILSRIRAALEPAVREEHAAHIHADPEDHDECVAEIARSASRERRELAAQLEQFRSRSGTMAEGGA